MKIINVLCCHYHAAAEHRVCAAFLSLHLCVQQEFCPPTTPTLNYSSAAYSDRAPAGR